MVFVLQLQLSQRSRLFRGQQLMRSTWYTILASVVDTLINSESCTERNVSFLERLVGYLALSVSLFQEAHKAATPSLSLSPSLKPLVLCLGFDASCRHAFSALLFHVIFEKKTFTALRKCSTGDKISRISLSSQSRN